MSKSLSHTRTDRALDQFLKLSRVAQQLGFSHQLIEDDTFKGDTIRLRGRTLVNFGLCSYLGLGDDPRLVAAAIDAITRYGNSYSSSLAYTALPMYRDLEERFEAMLDAHVTIAATTTLAHMAALPVIVRPGDEVLIDTYAHASLVSVLPSLQVNGVDVHNVPHNDLSRVADRAGSISGRLWYLSDGVYSMHGDTAPAERMIDLLNSYPNLWVYCDDAHGLGWEGVTGQGHFLRRSGWHERLVMAFGLAKSFGTMGGVIASKDEHLNEAVSVTGGPMLFGGPLPPAILGASVASADIHLSPELAGLQAELSERIELVNRFSQEIGLPITRSEHTPLWFVQIGPSLTTVSVVSTMLNDGFFVNGAIFPAVPRGKGGVRFTVTRYLSMSQIESMLTSLNEARLKYIGGEDVIDLTALEDSAEEPTTH
ncbi:MAG TPA: aminotransferase class I/II-fold pyridoxal phosphate-dependent enzyme [Acidimicrobiia bacterium]